jgi:hypothetical protein
LSLFDNVADSSHVRARHVSVSSYVCVNFAWQVYFRIESAVVSVRLKKT